jgi:3',5'-cyclic AMP phosphodiesterase CpdA
MTNRGPGLTETLAFLPSNSAPLPGVGIVARVRLFGDMHFGFTSAVRLAAVAEDLAALPPVDAILSTGDETHFGLPAEYAAASQWLGQWRVPFYTVTGNHTFWNASLRHKETSAAQYQRFVETWGQSMPFTWELGGVRFVGAGPMASDGTPTGASLTLGEIEALASTLAAAPAQPTVLVLHSPFRHTVLGDGGSANSVYTSDDFGFFQTHGARLLSLLAAAPQVILVINGHTHSPLRAHGLLSPIAVGSRQIPQFNAMALPFVRRDVPNGQHYLQDLVSWELAITTNSIVLSGRDHLARQYVARTTIPLPTQSSGPLSV